MREIHFIKNVWCFCDMGHDLERCEEDDFQRMFGVFVIWSMAWNDERR